MPLFWPPLGPRLRTTGQKLLPVTAVTCSERYVEASGVGLEVVLVREVKWVERHVERVAILQPRSHHWRSARLLAHGEPVAGVGALARYGAVAVDEDHPVLWWLIFS